VECESRGSHQNIRMRRSKVASYSTDLRCQRVNISEIESIKLQQYRCSALLYLQHHATPPELYEQGVQQGMVPRAALPFVIEFGRTRLRSSTFVPQNFTSLWVYAHSRMNTANCDISIDTMQYEKLACLATLLLRWQSNILHIFCTMSGNSHCEK
jgi:hypothetical protein